MDERGGLRGWSGTIFLCGRCWPHQIPQPQGVELGARAATYNSAGNGDMAWEHEPRRPFTRRWWGRLLAGWGVFCKISNTKTTKRPLLYVPSPFLLYLLLSPYLLVLSILSSLCFDPSMNPVVLLLSSAQHLATPPQQRWGDTTASNWCWKRQTAAG
jgi:hypothetical protein